jgi:hypothetical protein
MDDPPLVAYPATMPTILFVLMSLWATPSASDDIQLTPAQRKEYNDTFQRSEVKYLRQVLNAYVSGKELPDLAYDALKQFDSAYYRSKFIVISSMPPKGGGCQVQLIFQDRPDALFKAWVWRDQGSKRRFELRAFEQVDVGADSIAAIQRKYKRLLEDKVHAM